MTKGLANRKVIGKEENKASKKPREELLQEGEELLTQYPTEHHSFLSPVMP